jgi:hypothetical protein
MHVSEVIAASIIRAMGMTTEAVSMFETSANFYQTTLRNIPEDRHLNVGSSWLALSLVALMLLFNAFYFHIKLLFIGSPLLVKRESRQALTVLEQ